MPKTMTKADYEALGTNHGRNASGPLVSLAAYPRASKSWQARAYWNAYDEAIAKAKTTPMKVTILEEAAPISAKAWKGLQATTARVRVASGMVRIHSRLGAILTVCGPLYPTRMKGRSRRPGGWTRAAA